MYQVRQRSVGGYWLESDILQTWLLFDFHTKEGGFPIHTLGIIVYKFFRSKAKRKCLQMHVENCDI